jgi:hypothetical protein
MRGEVLAKRIQRTAVVAALRSGFSRNILQREIALSAMFRGRSGTFDHCHGAVRDEPGTAIARTCFAASGRRHEPRLQNRFRRNFWAQTEPNVGSLVPRYEPLGESPAADGKNERTYIRGHRQSSFDQRRQSERAILLLRCLLDFFESSGVMPVLSRAIAARRATSEIEIIEYDRAPHRRGQRRAPPFGHLRFFRAFLFELLSDLTLPR